MEQIYPKSFDEFIANEEYIADIRRWVSKFNFVDSAVSSQEDLFQDIVTAILQRGYIEAYDPEKRPFKVYLGVFVRNFLIPKYNRENKTKNGKKILYSKAIENGSPDDSSETNSNICYADMLEDVKNEDLNFGLLVEDARREAAKFKKGSEVVYKGKVFTRDPATVLDLVLQDYKVAEIAEIFDTSKQFVYNLMKKLRSMEVFAFYSKA